MTDLGSLSCNFVKIVDGFADVLGTLSKQSLANVFLNCTVRGQDSDKKLPRSNEINQTIAKHKPPNTA